MKKKGFFRRRRDARNGWMCLSAEDAPARGDACKNSVTRTATSRRVNFSAGSEIGACEHMRSYFQARLPPKGRSERGTPVCELFDRNGGRWKISPIKVVGGKVLRRWFGLCEASFRL